MRFDFGLAIVSFVALMAISQPAVAQGSNGEVGGPIFKGIVAPARSYDLAPPFDGQVIKIHFVPGELVEKGALLFTMDTTKENLERDRDLAIQKKAEAALRIAEVVVSNNAELRKKDVVSERKFLEAEAQRDIAAADAEQAAVQVRADDIKIKEMKLYAPFAGIMSRSTVAEGAHLIKQAREQTTMATITELDPIFVKAEVPYEGYTNYLKLLTPGEDFNRTKAMDRIEIILTLPNGEKLPQVGKIAGGGYEFDPVTQVMEVMVEFPNPNLLLRPGLQVTLSAKLKP